MAAGRPPISTTWAMLASSTSAARALEAFPASTMPSTTAWWARSFYLEALWEDGRRFEPDYQSELGKIKVSY